MGLWGGVVDEGVMVGAEVVVVVVEGLTVEEEAAVVVLLVDVDSVGGGEGEVTEAPSVGGWTVVDEERAEGEVWADASVVDWKGRVVGGGGEEEAEEGGGDEVGAVVSGEGVLILS